MKNWMGTMMTVAGLMTSANATEIVVSFDFEDFTNPHSWDAAKVYADLCTEEGIRANFNVVGYVARELVENQRTDVIEAVGRHDISTHTLEHSIHPNRPELADVEDFRPALKTLEAQEARGIEYLRRCFPGKTIWGACPPGNSDSWICDYFYARSGIRFYLGATYNGTPSEDAWMMNLHHLPYVSFECFFPSRQAVFDPKPTLDHLAKFSRVCFYAHPNMLYSTEFWDRVNYDGTNKNQWGKWEKAPQRPEAEVREFLRRVREAFRIIKADPRFKFSSLTEIAQSEHPRENLRRGDLPEIQRLLAADFAPMHARASWSIADVFSACVKFLRGEIDAEYRPGLVYGFTARPTGVKAPTTVTRKDLVAAAKAIRLEGFLPSEITVGNQQLGPADFLFAALEALTTDKDRFEVAPREQLGGYGPFPLLARPHLVCKWLFAPDYQDRYATERLRLQTWTIRYE